jgi:DNA-binding CsgD family transcriptional regulator
VVAAANTGLEQLLEARAALPGEAFAPGSKEDLVQPAMAAVFEAERRRATGEGDLADAWHNATTKCEAAGMGWLRHVALWRLGSALINRGDAGVEAAQALRAVHRYTSEQGARPLQVAVEDTARLARISLAEASAIEELEVTPSAFEALTRREREVLMQLVTGRTYAEIATALFISEKTVSVHVSNVLRKTDTRSGREVAALATRLGWGPRDRG